MCTKEGASSSHVQIVWSICPPICKIFTSLCLNLDVECVDHTRVTHFYYGRNFKGELIEQDVYVVAFKAGQI